MTFDVLNTWCVSTQFHPVLVISVPCWRALALKTTTRKKHPPHFLYNLFACRIGYWTCCFYCNLSQKKISVFSHSFVKFRPYFFIFFPAKSTPPPQKKTQRKARRALLTCWHDIPNPTPATRKNAPMRCWFCALQSWQIWRSWNLVVGVG